MNLSIYHQEREESFQVEVEGLTTVDVLKLKISATQNLNYNFIKLHYKGELLKDQNATMNQLGIKDQDLLTLHCKMPVKQQQTNP